ncbi:MAG: Gfo/Idh/MocA family oxidoreductase [Chloroflexi bacterium]|nr:Gfo/Idh/MocA family oxidoreductase [Chloroflexota bacterium]
MANQIRWGVISTANIGKGRVIPAIQKSSNGRVMAIASRHLEKAQAVAGELNIPTAYGSYEALLNDPNIDAIYNPLPNSEHAEWSIRCAEAGKPTLCEKPLARNAAEAQQMVDAFAQKGVPFAEAFMYRFHPQTDKVRELLAEGRIGDVHLLNASFTFSLNREDNIRLNKDLAGGALMDVGCYCVNVIRLLTGEEPVGVQGFAKFGEKSGVDESLIGLLQFPSGVLGHFDCGLRSHRVHIYEIRGSAGRILVEEAFTMRPSNEYTIKLWQGDQYQEIKNPAVDHHQLMAEDFADALLNNRPPRFPAQDAVENMRVVDQLLATARQRT